MIKKIAIPLCITLLAASVIAGTGAVISVRVMESKQLNFEQKLSKFDKKQDIMSALLVEMRTDVRWIKDKIDD